MTSCPWITANRKFGFIHLFPSHKIIVWKLMCIGNPALLHEGPAGRCETQVWNLYVLCWLYISFPPHIFTGLIYWVIYWVLRNNSLVHSFAVTRFCDTLVLTISSSLSSTATSSPFFTIAWERVSWPFLGNHYAYFRLGHLASQSCIQTLPLTAFGHH